MSRGTNRVGTHRVLLRSCCRHEFIMSASLLLRRFPLLVLPLVPLCVCLILPCFVCLFLACDANHRRMSRAKTRLLPAFEKHRSSDARAPIPWACFSDCLACGLLERASYVCTVAVAVSRVRQTDTRCDVKKRLNVREGSAGCVILSGSDALDDRWRGKARYRPYIPQPAVNYVCVVLLPEQMHMPQ